MRRFQLPLLGSNQDSPDPESGVLPVTPRGRKAARSRELGVWSYSSERRASLDEAQLLKSYSSWLQAPSFFNGAEGDRTPDLLIANEALSQLSYSPMKDGKSTGCCQFGQPNFLAYR